MRTYAYRRGQVNPFVQPLQIQFPQLVFAIHLSIDRRENQYTFQFIQSASSVP